MWVPGTNAALYLFELTGKRNYKIIFQSIHKSFIFKLYGRFSPGETSFAVDYGRDIGIFIASCVI